VRQAPQRQFNGERRFVGRLRFAWSKLAMHFNGATDDLSGEFIGLHRPRITRPEAFVNWRSPRQQGRDHSKRRAETAETRRTLRGENPGFSTILNHRGAKCTAVSERLSALQFSKRSQAGRRFFTGGNFCVLRVSAVPSSHLRLCGSQTADPLPPRRFSACFASRRFHLPIFASAVPKQPTRSPLTLSGTIRDSYQVK
jgi:hypothetical protein